MFSATEGVCDDAGNLIRQCTVGDIERLEISDPDHGSLLHAARSACLAGVARSHIISYNNDCALLEELFTHDGSGTLVANDSYEQAREANIDDVGGIIELIQPLEQQGVLVKRSRELLETEIRRFRLLERDHRIIACAALYPFAEETCGEIACIVSHPDYRGGQRGQRLLEELETEARRQGLDRVFVLTTQTAHWFIEQGFVESNRDALPERKQALYNLQRNSKVFFKAL
jgi:amino-acid N-acetyltransferase